MKSLKENHTKMTLILIAVITVSAVLAGCAAATGGGSDAYHKITAAQAKEMIDAGGVVIVDVRTPSEYSSEHIPGAINIPNETIDNISPAQLGDKSAVLLIYCRSGRRSYDAAQKLVKLGYTNVYDFGGIIDWGYDTVKGDG